MNSNKLSLESRNDSKFLKILQMMSSLNAKDYLQNEGTIYRLIKSLQSVSKKVASK